MPEITIRDLSDSQRDAIAEIHLRTAVRSIQEAEDAHILEALSFLNTIEPNPHRVTVTFAQDVVYPSRFERVIEVYDGESQLQPPKTQA